MKKISLSVLEMICASTIFLFSFSGCAGPAINDAESNIEDISSASSDSNIAKINGNNQIITTKLSNGYTAIVVQKGIPVKWTIKADASDITGCNQKMQIGQFNIEKQLVPGDNIIEFTPSESGTIPYSCWMNMIKSTITVVDDINNINKSAVGSLQNVISDNSMPGCTMGGGCCGSK